MSPEFKQRVLLPVLLPLLLLGLFLAFAFSLSRVFLAVPSATTATFLALLVAGYLLALAGVVSARPNIPSRALGVALVIGLGGVVVAGALGASAGMREVHQAGEEAAEADGDQAAEGGEAAEDEGDEGANGQGAEDDGEGIPEGALEFVAVDIDYQEAPETAEAGEAGEVTIAIDNQGNLLHDVTFEELGDETVVEAEGGETATDTTELEPGTYTYYCSVPGHRDAGMEGTLQVQ